LFFTEHIDQGV